MARLVKFDIFAKPFLFLFSNNPKSIQNAGVLSLSIAQDGTFLYLSNFRRNV